MTRWTVFLLVLLLSVKIALAQDAIGEITTGILRAILGELPAPCTDFSSATCTYCVTYLKIVPFTFFFGFFYLMIAFGLSRVRVSSSPSISVSLLIISAVLSLFLLHTGTITSALSGVNSFIDWIGWLGFITTFVLAIFTTTFLMQFGPVRNLLELVSNIINSIPVLGPIVIFVFRRGGAYGVAIALAWYVRTELTGRAGMGILSATEVIVKGSEICLI